MCNYRISIIFVSSWFFGFIVVDDALGLVLKCGHHIDFSAYMIPNGEMVYYQVCFAETFRLKFSFLAAGFYSVGLFAICFVSKLFLYFLLRSQFVFFCIFH